MAEICSSYVDVKHCDWFKNLNSQSESLKQLGSYFSQTCPDLQLDQCKKLYWHKRKIFILYIETQSCLIGCYCSSELA